MRLKKHAAPAQVRPSGAPAPGIPRSQIVSLLGRDGRLALVLFTPRTRRAFGGPALVLLLLVGRAGRLALVLLLGAGRPALAPLLGRVGRPTPVLLLGPRPSSSVARSPRLPSFSPALIGLLRIRSRTDEIEKSEDA